MSESKIPMWHENHNVHNLDVGVSSVTVDWRKDGYHVSFSGIGVIALRESSRDIDDAKRRGLELALRTLQNALIQVTSAIAELKASDNTQSE